MDNKNKPKTGRITFTRAVAALAASAAFGLGVSGYGIDENLPDEPQEKDASRYTFEIPDEGGKRTPTICVVEDFEVACGSTIGEAEYNLVYHPQPFPAAGHRFNKAAEPAAGKSAPVKTVAVARHTETTKAKTGTPSAASVVPTGNNQKIYAGLPYYVPENYDSVLKRITENDPISRNVMVKVLGSESGFKDQTSPTGAFSVGQFTFATFLETVYRNKNLLTKGERATVEKHIDQYNSADKGERPILKYRIAEGGSEDRVRALSKDPHVTSVLAREHMRTATKEGERLFRSAVEERIQYLRSDSYTGPRDKTYQHRLNHLEEHLVRPITTADVKLFYMAGSLGGAKILLAVADPRTHNNRASDYTTEHVAKNNPFVFNDENGRPRSVMQLKQYIVERVGNERLPASLDRASAGVNIAQHAPTTPTRTM